MATRRVVTLKRVSSPLVRKSPKDGYGTQLDDIGRRINIRTKKKERKKGRKKGEGY
jgi:hypothetical protein